MGVIYNVAHNHFFSLELTLIPKRLLAICLQWFMGQNINNQKKTTISLLVTSQEADVEVNAEKSKYMFIPHEEYTGRQHNTKASNKSFENVAKL
jgi:hypothetical protein